MTDQTTDPTKSGEIGGPSPPPRTTGSGPGYLLNRRRFVAGSVLAGSAVASTGSVLAGSAVAGCGVPDRDQPPEPADVSVTMLVNGQRRTVAVDTRTSLLDMLRERMALTGTKKGCNQGACGACTVLLGDRRINSCLTLAVMHDGAGVTTIEGLAQGATLHPLQRAFVDRDAFQCGYCTSGQIMSGVGCITEGHAGSPEEIREWMSGNICRCGAYTNIVDAVSDAAGKA